VDEGGVPRGSAVSSAPRGPPWALTASAVDFVDLADLADLAVDLAGTAADVTYRAVDLADSAADLTDLAVDLADRADLTDSVAVRVDLAGRADLAVLADPACSSVSGQTRLRWSTWPTYVPTVLCRA